MIELVHCDMRIKTCRSFLFYLLLMGDIYDHILAILGDGGCMTLDELDDAIIRRSRHRGTNLPFLIQAIEILILEKRLVGWKLRLRENLDEIWRHDWDYKRSTVEK